MPVVQVEVFGLFPLRRRASQALHPGRLGRGRTEFGRGQTSMTTAVDPGLQRALRRAAVAATRATSVLDTQPWRMVVRRESIEIHADRTRQLRHLDPDLRGLIRSCGSALANLLLSLSADGLGSRVERFPDPIRPDLIAVVHIDPDEAPAEDPLSAALRVSAIDSVCTVPTRLIGPPVSALESP